MKTFFLVVSGLALVLCLLLEGTVTTLPLVLLYLLSVAIVRQDEIVFLLALASGVCLDILTLRPVGETAIFFVVFLFVVMLYDRKYEIHSLPFVAASSFVGSFLYLLFFVRRDMVVQSLVSALMATVLFLIYRMMQNNTRSDHYGAV